MADLNFPCLPYLFHRVGAPVPGPVIPKEVTPATLAVLIRDLARSFQADWQTIIRVEVCEALNPYIDNVLQNHPLRGFDAVHLASALLIGQQLSAPLFFACFDQQLNQAARENGLPVF